MCTFIVCQRKSKLFQVVDTLDPLRGLAGRLDRGQQQGDQDRDDRDHNQQFDEGETSPYRGSYVHS